MAEQGLSRSVENERAARLLAWYDRNARVLPWRLPAGNGRPDPYRVWLSEVMLQQTTVAAVKDYYLAFTARWPTVEALAAASLDDVLRMWAGLGYYARARNLHACARAVVARHGGVFPDTEEELRTLPGIGLYTAGAIAAIAFERRAVAVDGNVERVISRLFAVEVPLPESKQLLRAHAASLVPNRRAGDFAQALMDLGATICTPKRRNCLICPWTEECLGRRRGIADTLPRKKEKAARPVRRGVAFWIERDGKVLLRRRPESGLLGGMMEIPSTAWMITRQRYSARLAPLAARWDKSTGHIAHTFTHFHLELDIWRATAISDGELRGDGDYRWVAAGDLAAEALPSVMRKIVAAVGRA